MASRIASSKGNSKFEKSHEQGGSKVPKGEENWTYSIWWWRFCLGLAESINEESQEQGLEDLQTVISNLEGY